MDKVQMEEQVQMEYWEMDTAKVNAFNFLNDEVEEFTNRWSQSLVNVRSPSYLKQKKFSNIVYEVSTDYIFSFSLEHSGVLLVWVKYMVKYIHICIKFLIHDKLKW